MWKSGVLPFTAFRCLGLGLRASDHQGRVEDAEALGFRVLLCCKPKSLECLGWGLSRVGGLALRLAVAAVVTEVDVDG